MRRAAILAGRRYQGRIYVAGIPVQSEQDSRLSDASAFSWDTAAPLLKEPLMGGTQTSPFIPIVSINTLTPGLDDVDTVAVDHTLRVQRRREVGVGE